MSASSTSNFAVGIDKLSLKDNTSRTSSEQPLETAAETQPHPATLLGLPQELRDNIFEHVYEVLGSPDDRIMLMLCLDIYRRRKGFPEAAVPSSQAPNSCPSIGVAVETQCRFEAGEWTATFNNSDDLWRYLCDHWRWWNWTGPEPRGLHRLTVFDSEIR
jgi:hypothetical protein